MKFVRILLPLVLVAAFLASCKAPTTPSAVVPGKGSFTPSVDATGATDVADQMAAFVAAVPNGSTINLRAGGQYRMEKTLNIEGRRSLTIRGNGATFLMTTPGDRSTADAARRTRARPNVAVTTSTDISIYDLNVVGANPAAGEGDAAYRPEYEAQHAFDILNSTRVSLIGSSARDTYGDFVYIGGGFGGVSRSTDVVVRGFTGLRSGRQGITVTSASRVLIENSTLSLVRRSTFDFEPEGDATVDNVTIRNNRIYGGRLNFVAAQGHGAIDHITIQGNRLTDHVLSVNVQDLDGGRRSDWKILDNVGGMDSIDHHWAGNPNGAVILLTRVDGAIVRNNNQTMRLGEAVGGPKPYMYGVKATDSTNVVVTGNAFYQAVGQLNVVTTVP